MTDPENPTIDDFAGQVRELARRLESINRKMQQLNASSPDVKRFVAYANVAEEYTKLLNAYSQQVGLLYCAGPEETADDQGA